MRTNGRLTTSMGMLGIAAAIAWAAQAQADSCGSASAHTHKASDEAQYGRDIVDTAVAAGGFGTLVTAAKEAGLVSVLKGSGPFTVFAPTDEAFASLPEGALEGLLADKDRLTAVLTYHVVPGRVRAAQVSELDEANTVFGQPVRLETANGSVTVDNAKVIKADIETSNGVIHVIDRVLMPRDLVGFASSAPELSTLVTAIQAAGLVEILKGQGPFTIFAPVNEAFAKLPAGALDALLADKARLTTVLAAHVVEGKVLAADVVKVDHVSTLKGYNATVTTNGGVRVDRARVIKTDMIATNGVVHLIDRVILPPES